MDIEKHSIANFRGLTAFFDFFFTVEKNIVHYYTEVELSHDSVPCITQDRDGFMWFGTFDGLSRFGGTNFNI